jgi:Uma2 family endonuclease
MLLLYNDINAGFHESEIDDMTTSPIQIVPFDHWVLLPENVDKRYELIAGEIVEKMVSNQEASEIAATILAYIKIYLLKNPIGRVRGADGGYHIGTERYIPDVSYMSKARQSERNKDSYNPLAPDLAVEVLSPTDTPKIIRVKVMNYLAAGTVVWLVSPESQEIEVYIAGQPARVLGIDDTLDGGTVLPGFTMAVKQAFEDD